MKWEKMHVGMKVCPAHMPATVHFDIMPFGPFLMIRTDDITSNIIRDIEFASAQFRVIAVGKHLVFLSRFGMCPWQCSYFHRASAYIKEAPSLSGNGLPLYVILVDRQTGKVKARRVFSLDRELAIKLCSLIETQDPDDPLLNNDIYIRRIQQRYTPIQLATKASVQWRI